MNRISIIGAGPAGSTAAIHLARSGIEVTLIEQQRFPRDKVCGECLSALGIEVLSRLGLDAKLRRCNAVVLRRALLCAPDGNCAEVRLPRPMLGISRAVLDEFLLDAARTAGARVLQPTRCEAIVAEPTPVLRGRNLESNELRSIQADLVLVADGKGALLPEPPAPTGDFGVKAHFTGVALPSDAIALFGGRDHYGGVAPIAAERWNLAFSVPAARLQAHRGDLDGLFDEIVAENRALNRRMRTAERCSGWLVSPLPRFGVASAWPTDVIPIGNAAAAIEPIGGEGMGLAMRSGELAADAIIRAVDHQRRPDVDSLAAEYRRLWRFRRPACRAAALLASRPTLARLATRWAQTDDTLTGLALRAFGKC